MKGWVRAEISRKFISGKLGTNIREFHVYQKSLSYKKLQVVVVVVKLHMYLTQYILNAYRAGHVSMSSGGIVSTGDKGHSNISLFKDTYEIFQSFLFFFPSVAGLASGSEGI